MKKTQQKEVFFMSTFRKATEVDIPAITAIYDHTHDLEERGETTIGWIRGVYPTEETAREALDADDLFVMEEDGAVVAAARINQAQVDCYARANWSFDAAPEQVMVLHTLVVEPAQKGHGFGPQFVQFYEDYARAHGCPVLRIDTNARNQAARRLYARLGYREADIVHCDFNAIRGIDLVCLEKKLEWRVFYGKNFWATRGRGKPGVEISLGHRFRWGDADWRALSLYACAKGLVLDLAKHVPAEDVRRFVEKWAPLEEAGLTPEQAEQALMESPFHDSFRATLLVNGRSIRSEGGSGFAWRPDTEQDLAEQAVARALRARSGGALAALAAPLPVEAADGAPLALTDAHRRSRLAARPAVHSTAGANCVVHAPVDRNEPYAHGSGPRAGDAGRVRSAGFSGISRALFEAGVYRLAGAAAGRAANSGRGAHRSAPAEDPGEQLRRSAGQRRGVHRDHRRCRWPDQCFCVRRRAIRPPGSPIPASILLRRSRSRGSCGFRSSRVGKFQKNFVDFLLAISRKRARISASF